MLTSCDSARATMCKVRASSKQPFCTSAHRRLTTLSLHYTHKSSKLSGGEYLETFCVCNCCREEEAHSAVIQGQLCGIDDACCASPAGQRTKTATFSHQQHDFISKATSLQFQLRHIPPYFSEAQIMKNLYLKNTSGKKKKLPTATQ